MCTAARYLLFVLALSRSITAFNVTFFSDDQCSRRFLGTVILGKSQGCHQDFAGVAGSASVGSTGAVDDKTFVQFYSTSDCSPGSETASSEDECVEIDGPDIDFYRSFRVIDDVVTPPLQPNITLNPEDAGVPPTSTPKRNIESANNILERDTASLVDTTKMYHGKRAHVDGIDYIWHQVYAGGYRGIPVDDWDPEEHIEERRSLDELLAESGMESKRSLLSETSPVAPHVLEERQNQQSLGCRIHQQCIRALFATGIGLNALISITLDDVKNAATASGRKLNEFMQVPFVSQLSAGYLANILAIKTDDFWSSKNVPSPVVQPVTVVIHITGNVDTLNACSTDSVTVDPGNDDLGAANQKIAETLQNLFVRNPLKQNAMGVAYAVSPATNPKKRGALLESRDTNIVRLTANAMPCLIPFNGDVCGLQTGLCDF